MAGSDYQYVVLLLGLCATGFILLNRHAVLALPAGWMLVVANTALVLGYVVSLLDETLLYLDTVEQGLYLVTSVFFALWARATFRTKPSP